MEENLIFWGWQQKALLIILAVLVFNFTAKWVLRKLHKRFERRKEFWKDSLCQALYLPISVYTWFVALAYAFSLFLPKIDPDLNVNDLKLWLEVVAILCFAWFALRWKHTITHITVLRSRRGEIEMEQRQIDLLDKLATLLILVLTGLFMLEISGRGFTTLLAFGGIGGLAVAFASQEIIANYFGGFMIYVVRPFNVGDWINLPEKQIEGHVEEIGWYMTQIQTFDKRPIYVPNGTFSKTFVETPSRMSHRRLKENVRLRYKDMSAVDKIVKKIDHLLRKHEEIDKEQPPLVNLDALGHYSIDIVISAYSATAVTSEKFARLKQEILLEILQVVEDCGAEIALPPS